jgi:hypothetical protein
MVKDIMAIVPLLDGGLKPIFLCALSRERNIKIAAVRVELTRTMRKLTPNAPVKEPN